MQGLISNPHLAKKILPDLDRFELDYKIINRIAEDEQLTITELAFAYVSSLGKIDAILLGSTSLSNINSALRGIKKSIAVSTLDKLNSVASSKKRYSNPKEWNI